MRRTYLRKTIVAGFAIALMATVALGLSAILNVQGTIDSFSFPEFPQFNGPANAEMVGLTLKPGDVIPWHYHQGPAIVIVSHGTLTEDDGCGHIREFGAGSAFSEEPGHIHQVSNQGSGAVILYFAAVYPVGQEDAVFVDGPDCH
jgi:quercetin dioxygenase-like cupin family protein